MTKRAESKYKINRRLGVNLWGRPSPRSTSANTAPASTASAARRPTDFGTQLMAKQKLKGYYGNISEKQFRKYYEEAVRRKGDTSREPDRAAGAPAGCGDLPHEVRHHAVRRAPVRLARPCAW